jgi:hypothetical protein
MGAREDRAAARRAVADARRTIELLRDSTDPRDPGRRELNAAANQLFRAQQLADRADQS